jgi:hypothetical protein
LGGERTRAQRPNRLLNIRPTPENTLCSTSPTPDAIDAFEDLSASALSVLAVLAGLAFVGAAAAESLLDEESSLDTPSHRPTFLNTLAIGPSLCDDEAWPLTDSPEALELDSPFDWCLVGPGATALPLEPSDPPPGPAPGPPDGGAEGSGVTSATRCTAAASWLELVG